MKNDTFTLWGVQEPNTGTLLHHYLTRDDAHLWCHGNNRVVKLECRIVEQRPKKRKTFVTYGLEWVPHKPGDPMPCDGETKVLYILRRELEGRYINLPSQASRCEWGVRKEMPEMEIIGWNFAH